ncbi:MAG: hypothetical protein U1E35_08865 [Rhodospirillales bacterium]
MKVRRADTIRHTAKARNQPLQLTPARGAEEPAAEPVEPEDTRLLHVPDVDVELFAVVDRLSEIKEERPVAVEGRQQLVRAMPAISASAKVAQAISVRTEADVAAAVSDIRRCCVAQRIQRRSGSSGTTLLRSKTAPLLAAEVRPSALIPR